MFIIQYIRQMDKLLIVAYVYTTILRAHVHYTYKTYLLIINITRNRIKYMIYPYRS
jgi:hypothetical protein